MASKAEVIEKIDPTKTYVGSYVVARVNEVTCDNYIPKTLKKGDVISYTLTNKPRPVVVIKVLKDKVIGIPLTSEESVHSLIKHENSRFFDDGWFCSMYVTIEMDLAIKKFIGVFDNNNALNQAIKELKLFINKNI